MRRIAFTAVLLLAGNAGAQILYKCVSTSGTSYQQLQCPAGARTVRTIEVALVPPTTQEPPDGAGKVRSESRSPAHATVSARPRVSDQRTRPRVRMSSTPRDPVQARCESAKTQRARTLDEAGLDRNFDMLRSLDDRVAAACHR